MNPGKPSFITGKTITTQIVVASVILFANLLMVFVFKNKWLDETVFNSLSPHTTAARTHLFRDISFFGNHRFLVPANLLLIAYFIITKNKCWAIRVGGVALSSLGLMSLLKNLIQRDRPVMPLVDGITNYGFPSGHALMSVAFFGLLIMWTAEIIKNKAQRNLIICFYIFLVVVIGFTRIYLRVHYTTDVIAGWCTGVIWLGISVLLIEKLIPAKR
ncbi:MAG: phosphatase PAP2 family protein [Sphingobacteriales bacterium]|nr:phosphatase PAP2 family protein [Sphingobacteriales bacterium]